MSTSQWAFAAVFLFSVNNIAVADEQLFRCVEANGGISFQKIRCTGQGEPIQVGSVQGGWTSLRSGEKALLKTYRERDAKRRQRTHKVVKKTQPAETTTCWNKRKRLDAVKAKLRRGYKPSQGEGLRRQRNNYEEYLEKFCP